MKVDYSKGIIYAIRSYSTDDVYIGSTCSTLTKRLSEHKKDYEIWLKKDYKYVTSYEVLKHDDYYIELVEECPCENKAQLNRREGEVIRSVTCVNKCVAGRTPAEWNKDNAQKVAALHKEWAKKNKQITDASKKKYNEQNKAYLVEYRKKYKEENKERLAARKAEKVTCGCGSVVRRDSRARHERSAKHEQYLNNLIRELDEEASTRQGAQAAGEGDQ